MFKAFFPYLDKMDLEKKRDENTINDFAEKTKIFSSTNMVTKKMLHTFVAKDVIKNKMITVAGQMFLEKEKKLDNSNQLTNGYGYYIGDTKI